MDATVTAPKLEVRLDTKEVFRNGVKITTFHCYLAGLYQGEFSCPTSAFAERVAKCFPAETHNVKINGR